MVGNVNIPTELLSAINLGPTRLGPMINKELTENFECNYSNINRSLRTSISERIR